MSFRKKIFLGYFTVFCLFIVLMQPFIQGWARRIIFQGMESCVSEIIVNIREASDNDDLVKKFKEQKIVMYFRSSVITDERKVLYDSHSKRVLGSAFSQEYVVNHPEVVHALAHGTGYHEDYSQILNQHFAYFAKTFDFHGKTYVVRTAFPHQYVMEISRAFEVGCLFLSAVILALFSLMTWSIIHYFTKPIQKIVAAVKSYDAASHQSFPPIDVGSGSHDDIGRLAMTLNSLSARVQQHIDTITKERNEKETILESLSEGVIAVNPSMEVTYANYMVDKLLGPFSNTLVGAPVDQLSQEGCRLLKRCCIEKRALSDVLQIQRDEGLRYLDLIASPKKDNAGAILVIQDKTSHYEMFEMKKGFVANASHELRTPITVILGYAETLHDHPDLPPEMQQSMTEKIVKNCKRMTALIQDLLTLADIDHLPPFRLQENPLLPIVQRCCEMLQESFPTAQVSIVEAAPGTQFCGDPNLLALAVWNLLENGAKYSPIPAQLKATIGQLGDEIYIEVEDQGLGIPPADQEKVFDRFYTVDKARSQKMGGSGLGLSIVKTVVQKHRGRISLVSALGRGSKFTLFFPKAGPWRDPD